MTNPPIQSIVRQAEESTRRSHQRRNARAERSRKIDYYMDQLINLELIILFLMLIATAIYAVTEVIN